MEAYLLLVVSSGAFAFLSVLVYLRSRFVGFLFGFAALYYWTLYGAWFIVYENVTGELGPTHHHYLFSKLFSVVLDEDYYATLLLYSLFLITVQITVLLTVSGKMRLPYHVRPLRVNHWIIILISFAAFIASYFIVKDAISLSTQTGISAYLVSREQGAVSLFTIHQILNRAAIVPASLGLAILLSGRQAILIGGSGGFCTAIAYVLLLGGLYYFCAILGNKNELAFAGACGVIFYLVNNRRPHRLLVLAFGFIFLSLTMLVDAARGLPGSEVTSVFSLERMMHSVVALTTSNEAFAAHFSLYGILRYDVPLIYGSDFVAFVASVVPRVLWPDRPSYGYWHYVHSVGARGGQGYTIHHAAAWFLNFHVAGIVLGALVLGLVWSKLFNAWGTWDETTRPLKRMFLTIAAISFSAYMPCVMRAGIGAYKGVIVDAFLVPSLILYAAACWPHESRSRHSGTGI